MRCLAVATLLLALGHPAHAAGPAAPAVRLRLPAATQRSLPAGGLQKVLAESGGGRAAAQPNASPAVVSRPPAHLNVLGTETALATLNAWFGLPRDVPELDSSISGLTRDATGRLSYSVIERRDNSQAFTELVTLWRPEETTLVLLTENNGIEGAFAVQFECAPNAKCGEQRVIEHLNSVNAGPPQVTHSHFGGMFYFRIPKTAIPQLFSALDTVYTYLQAHP